MNGFDTMSGRESKLLSLASRLVGKLKGYGEGLELLGSEELGRKLQDDAESAYAELRDIMEAR